MPVSMKKLALACAGASLLAGGTASAATGPPPPTAVNGHHVKLVASGLGTPTSFAFGGGTTFEGDAGNNQSGPPNGGIYVLKGGKATRLAGSPQYVAGLAWHKNALYVSGGYALANGHAKFQLLKLSGWNGTKFTHKRAIFTAPKKLLGLNGIAFGSDGRLYVGAGVGPTEGFDHKPASFAPYLYDILSISPNGKGLKVYASGIRQPWQIAFAPGSKSPFVSGLGQDSGAKNPPDFLFKVKQGDNYGFPQCNHTKGSKCKGFAKPFKLFSPHMDIMGLAIIGKTLYMTSFLGSTGQAGEVFSMPLRGGKLKTVVHGFVAPTVGLGQHAGSLYIGELTGQVFSVKP